MKQLAVFSEYSGSRAPRLPHKRLASILRIGVIMVAAWALILSINRLDPAFHFPDWLFLSLSLILILAEIYWTGAPYLKCWLDGRSSHKISASTNLYSPQNSFYQHRKGIRIFLQAAVILACILVSFHLSPGDSPETTMLVTGFFLYALIFLAWVESAGIRYYGLGPKWWIWMPASLLLGSTLGIAIFRIDGDPVLALLFAGTGTGVALAFYLAERVEVGDRVWADVIRDLIITLLDIPDAPVTLAGVVSQIGTRLGYERVFILEPSTDKTTLSVIAEYGDYPSVLGKSFPAQNGLTGKAFSSAETYAENDVRQCEDYQRLVDPRLDNTRAEIAIPILHRGKALGILDVQSKSSMVYGPGDLRSLEVIGRILGAAQAGQKTDILLEQAGKLWDSLSKDLRSENEIFEALAEFARKELKADNVFYYRLSPTGFPLAAPQVIGDLLDKDHMLQHANDLESPLFELIGQWKPVYEEHVRPGGSFFGIDSAGRRGFATREEVESAFFIPIGTAEERLAVVFFNYRHHQVFDSLFQMMVLGFSQAFATVLARERYRQLMFRGFGRPEVGIHNILARYGMKDGVAQEGRELIRLAGGGSQAGLNDSMIKLLEDVDNCLIELRAQSTKISSDWEHSLYEMVEDLTRKMKDHVPMNRSVRFSKAIDPFVERESSWTRFALYRVIDEAVNNAIFHGNATEIQINVQRHDNTVSLTVENNGRRLPDDSPRRRSRSGIYSILDELRDQFRADVHLESKPGEEGAVLTVEVPALPNKRERR